MHWPGFVGIKWKCKTDHFKGKIRKCSKKKDSHHFSFDDSVAMETEAPGCGCVLWWSRKGDFGQINLNNIWLFSSGHLEKAKVRSWGTTAAHTEETTLLRAMQITFHRSSTANWRVILLSSDLIWQYGMFRVLRGEKNEWKVRTPKCFTTWHPKCMYFQTD